MKNNNGIYTEIEKPTGWVSVYMNGKIYYMEQIFYYIESDITHKLFTIENDNELLVKLYPFKSSKYNIDLKTELTATIKNIKTDVNGISRIINESYVLYIDKTTNKMLYSYKDNYDSKNNDYIKLVDIDVYQDTDNVYLTDMRQLGGGLSNEAKNDYDLLDIGHVNGRPYRKGNTLIVTMPKKYESHKQLIQETLEKYKIGEDFVVLFFEDKED